MATDESFWEIRQRIYDRSQRYISFSSRRWQGPDRNRFRGGLDALHDTEEALWSLSKGLPKTEAQPNSPRTASSKPFTFRGMP